MIVFSPTDLNAIEADLIIESGSDIYLCYSGRLDGAPDTSKSNWKIKKLEVTDSDTIGNITGNVTKVMYPNGSQQYAFSPELIDTYTFDYAR